jgi:hypothetical protein
MNGLIAELFATTINKAANTNRIINGANHHLLRTLKKSTSSNNRFLFLDMILANCKEFINFSASTFSDLNNGIIIM